MSKPRTCRIPSITCNKYSEVYYHARNILRSVTDDRIYTSLGMYKVRLARIVDKELDI